MRKFPSSITGLSFSPDGSMLAVSTTWMYEDEEMVNNTLFEPSITIRKVSELEVKPK